jgi:DNA polymerase III sliding clamp (beta) subunit (PCNA family)
MDVLNTINSEEVKITLIDANSRIFIEEPNHPDSLFLVMPLQL